jgi:hypothetical protein
MVNVDNSSNPLGSADIIRFGIDPRLQACMGQVAEILRQHGLEGKIGLSVLHEHFQVGDDELMFESSDSAHRALKFEPVKRSAIDPQDVFISIWEPSEGKAMGCCPRTQQCHQILGDLLKIDLI